MYTSGIGSVGGTSATQQRGLGTMKSEDFFRILVTELQNQDPFQPAKTSDMISQVAQIRDIELSGKLTSTLDQLTAQQRTIGASDLIGKFVVARLAGPDGAPVDIEGVVTGVRFDTDGSAVLELDTGTAVPVSAVQRVTSVEQAMNAAALPSNDESAEPDNVDAADGSKATAAAKPQRPSLLGWDWLRLDGAFSL